MFCTHCGKEIPQGAEFCPHCGKPTRTDGQQPNYGYGQPYRQPSSQDTGNTGWAVLGFFIPLVGLILYLIWQNDRPKDARMAGKGALIGVIVEVCVGILFAVIFGIAMAAAISSAYTMLPLLS